MKNKNIKLIIFVGILLLIFGIFLFFTFKKYNYKLEYKINEYKVIESYKKNDSYYTFLVETKDQKYLFLKKNKYLRNRELINDIKVYRQNDEICILPQSDKVVLYPLCSNSEEVYAYNLSQIMNVTYNYKELKKENKEYENIIINSFNDASYLIYNYKGFYMVNQDNMQNIELFDKGKYSIILLYQKDNYLLIPDYNEDYYFNKIHLINIINGKTKQIKFDYNISFDSMFLGEYQNKVYLLDKKEEKEYAVDIKNEKVEEVDFQTMQKGKLVKTTYKNIVNNNLVFPTKNIYDYEIIDETLYLVNSNIKIRLSNLKVDKIVKNADETVYYLSKDKLYMYNNEYGEVLLMSYFEWNFNNTNIFLYK
ncbi:MAG: hypothetical protein E7161_04800 [Firmicutes bacterium]|nr:hypothetical protein [Bacillota bacterium]